MDDDAGPDVGEGRSAAGVEVVEALATGEGPASAQPVSRNATTSTAASVRPLERGSGQTIGSMAVHL